MSLGHRRLNGLLGNVAKSHRPLRSSPLSGPPRIQCVTRRSHLLYGESDRLEQTVKNRVAWGEGYSSRMAAIYDQLECW